MNNHDFTPRIFINCCLFLTMLIFVSPSHAGYSFEELDSYLNPEVKTISMDFNGAALTTVLKIFSQQSGMNFIASSEVGQEEVSLYLDGVPVEEALDSPLSLLKIISYSPTSKTYFSRLEQRNNLPIEILGFAVTQIFEQLGVKEIPIENLMYSNNGMLALGSAFRLSCTSVAAFS